MKLGQFYDAETTGLPEYGKPSGSDSQPHIVQLAAKVVNLETKEVLKEMNLIVKPDGWIIPDEVIEIHGVTNEIAEAKGIPEMIVVDEFFKLWNYALGLDPETKRIGHNESFDRRIIRIATKRFAELEQFEAPWHELEKPRSFCTMHKSRKPVGLKKVPTLCEAYEHFTGNALEGAHDAMNDVDACIEVYWHVQEYLQSQEAA